MAIELCVCVFSVDGCIEKALAVGAHTYIHAHNKDNRIVVVGTTTREWS